MTDALKYGPQTAEVEAFLARARTLSDVEVLALTSELGTTRGTARDAVWGAMGGAAWYTMGGALGVAVRGAAWGAVQSEVRYEVRDAALDAVCALVARDLITPDRFTQAHYDLLTRPWRKTIGKVHPDDAEVAVV